MLLGEYYLVLGLNAKVSWEQTRIRASSGLFPPPPAHRQSGHLRSEQGWVGEENILPGKLKIVTSCPVERLIIAQSKAVSEPALIFNNLFQIHTEAPPS